MRKTVIGMLAALGLAGCQTTQEEIIRTEYVVVKPSAAMYKCNVPTRLPNPDTLTDIQVARVIEQLYYSNIECRNSLRAIKAFLEKADGTVQANPTAVRQWISSQKL